MASMFECPLESDYVLLVGGVCISELLQDCGLLLTGSIPGCELGRKDQYPCYRDLSFICLLATHMLSWLLTILMATSLYLCASSSLTTPVLFSPRSRARTTFENMPLPRLAMT